MRSLRLPLVFFIVGIIATLYLAFRLVLARSPSAVEQSILLASWQRQQAGFKTNPTSATKLLAVGESKRNDKLDVLEQAAWTSVCNLLFNLDEALTKE